MSTSVWIRRDHALAALHAGESVHRWAARAMDDCTVVHAWPEQPPYTVSGDPLPCLAAAVRQGGAEAAVRAVRDRLPFPAPDARALVVTVEPGPQGPLARAWLAADESTVEATVHLVAGRDAILSRARGVVDTDSLADRSVAVIGLGSGGSTVAMELARAGVGRFVLVDFDRLEPSNISRHACGLEDLGRAKTLAVRDAVLRRNPWAVVRAVHMDINEDPLALRQLLRGADLVVGATDDRRSRSNINQAAVSLGVTTLFGRVLSRGSGGDVLRVRPHRGPCLSCVFGQGLLSGEEEISQPAQARRMAPEYVSEAEIEARVHPGLSADIAPVCTMIARLALHELSRGLPTALASLDADLAADLYVWGNRREGAYAHLEPMGYRFDRSAILRWYGARVSRDPQCLACSDVADTADTAFFGGAAPSQPGRACEG